MSWRRRHQHSGPSKSCLLTPLYCHMGKGPRVVKAGPYSDLGEGHDFFEAGGWSKQHDTSSLCLSMVGRASPPSRCYRWQCSGMWTLAAIPFFGHVLLSQHLNLVLAHWGMSPHGHVGKGCLQKCLLASISREFAGLAMPRPHDFVAKCRAVIALMLLPGSTCALLWSLHI